MADRMRVTSLIGSRGFEGEGLLCGEYNGPRGPVPAARQRGRKRGRCRGRHRGAGKAGAGSAPGGRAAALRVRGRWWGPAGPVGDRPRGPAPGGPPPGAAVSAVEQDAEDVVVAGGRLVAGDACVPAGGRRRARSDVEAAAPALAGAAAAAGAAVGLVGGDRAGAEVGADAAGGVEAAPEAVAPDAPGAPSAWFPVTSVRSRLTAPVVN